MQGSAIFGRPEKIVRFYGGATANKSEEQALDEINIYRTLIAKYTATLIEDKDILFMNTSSNALQVLSMWRPRM